MIARNILDRIAKRIVDRRPPDFIIGGDNDPYLMRWWVIPRNRWFNVYLHRFIRSDDDRALHDHPWVNLSILLHGSYLEYTPAGTFYRRAGDIVFRRASAAHRIALVSGDCWTFFLTGPRVREWGFHCPKWWVHWRDFTAGKRGEIVGKGCDQ